MVWVVSRFSLKFETSFTRSHKSINNDWIHERDLLAGGDLTTIVSQPAHQLIEYRVLWLVITGEKKIYKITGMLKTIKIPTVTPTCFCSRRNHHQGAISCLAKTTKMFLCARRYWRDQCHGGIPACCASLRYTVGEGTNTNTCVWLHLSIVVILSTQRECLTWNWPWILNQCFFVKRLDPVA
jgi:hypothetical protein